MTPHKPERCQACQQIIMVRRRNLRSELVYGLQQLYDLNRPAKVSELKLSRGGFADFTKLKYWGFIERESEETWKITRLGLDFLNGEVSVPKYKWVFNDTVQKDPKDEKNPEVVVWEIRSELLSRKKVNQNSLSMSQYSARQQGDLFI